MIRYLAATTLLLSTVPASAAPAPITGRWVTQGGQAVVEVASCGKALCGRIVRILKPRPGGAAVDANNPDKALRSRPIQGLAILSNFTADDDHWRGRIYDPESGRTYRSELRGSGGTLKVKGCFGPFCRTQTWTRAS